MVATQPEHVHNDRFDSDVAAACHQACIVIVVNIEISSGDVEGPEQSIRAKQQAYGKQKQQKQYRFVMFCYTHAQWGRDRAVGPSSARLRPRRKPDEELPRERCHAWKGTRN